MTLSYDEAFSELNRMVEKGLGAITDAHHMSRNTLHLYLSSNFPNGDGTIDEAIRVIEEHHDVERMGYVIGYKDPLIFGTEM